MMLIVIGDAFCEAAPSLKREDVTGVLRLLMLAHREGKHCVTVSRQGLKSLSDLELPDDLRGALSRLGLALYEGAALRKAVSTYVEVVPAAGITTMKDGLADVFRVGYSFFDDSSRVQRSVLLAENSTDGAFYCRIADAFAREVVKAPTFPTLETRLGGGGTTAGVYRLERDQGRLIAAIVDSDSKHSGGSKGSTSRTLEEAVKERAHVVGLLILSVRELENLLPPGVVSRACDGDPTLRTRAECSIKRGFAGDSVGVGAFVDHKSGHSLRLLRDVEGTGKPHALAVISTARAKDASCGLHCPEGREKCREASEKDEDPCGCIVVPALGERLLERSLDVVKETSFRELAKMFFDDPEWVRIAKLVFSYGINAGRSAA